VNADLFEKIKTIGQASANNLTKLFDQLVNFFLRCTTQDEKGIILTKMFF